MEKQLYPLAGIVTVLNTPFGDDLAIDLPSLRKNVRIALEAGVSGFLVSGIAAEADRLSITEKLQIAEAVLEEVNGAVPVIAGAGETELGKNRKLIRYYLRAGCNNILVRIPYLNPEQFSQNFYELAALGPEMIMLQDWDPVGYGLPDELICRLFHEVEAFRCLKIETVPAGVKYSRMLEMTDGKLHVSGGWAVSQMTEALTRGVHAFMPTGMHSIYTTIYARWQRGEKSEAEQLFREILPVLSFSNQHLDISIRFFKQLLHRQGVYQTPLVREPLLPFDKVHREIAFELIEWICRIENRLRAQQRQEMLKGVV
ncbi:MAG: dihydrodipicolinate synthase family protein [Marinilabiliales bacterium]|nr:dihydrodipicolinate synthase family protein [Marinilabiliales bacterium]